MPLHPQTSILRDGSAVTGPQDVMAAWVARYAPSAELFVREVLGVDPTPDQCQVFAAYDRGDRRISIRSGHGTGKAHDVDTMVPTPHGTRRWGDLQVGDVLFGTDGVTRITGTFPQGVRPMYRVRFDDGASARVDGSHLWTVLERRGKVRTLETHAMAAEGTHRKNGRLTAAKWKLPAYRAVECAGCAPFDPYLFGVWLGDGHHGGQIAQGVANAAEIHGVTWRVSVARPTVAVGTAPGLRAAIRAAGLAHCTSPLKFVPDQYKLTSARERHALLQGLLDTDGTVDRRGIVSFCSTSKRLAEDVVWLVRSLGGVASLHPTPKRPFYRDGTGQKVMGALAYTASVTLPPDWPPFRLSAKAARVRPPSARGLSRYIVAIEPDGAAAAMCVAVDAPDHLYLTTDFVVTHNTLTFASLIAHHMCTRCPQKTLVTAPTSSQLFDALAAETHKWFGRMPAPIKALFNLTGEQITLIAAPAESFTSFRTSRADNPEALAGVHAHDGSVMLIADEASGVPEAVYRAAAGSMSGLNARTLLGGNPVRVSGLFFDTHNKADVMSRWTRFHWSTLKSPLVASDFVDDIISRHGIDSNEYRVRVLGEFPLHDADTVIPRDLAVAALTRAVEATDVKPIWGVDCAGMGQDKSALAKRKGNVLLEPTRIWSGLNTMQLVGRISHEYNQTPGEDRPSEICVDAIGLGAGVADRLREVGLPARSINVSELPDLSGLYVNLRAELWFKARDWFAAMDSNLAGDELLMAELIEPTAEPNSAGRWQIESKKEMKRRGVKSPNRADAFVMTFAGEAITALGFGGLGSWTKPLSRPLRSLV